MAGTRPAGAARKDWGGSVGRAMASLTANRITSEESEQASGGPGLKHNQRTLPPVPQPASFTFSDLAPFLSPENMDFSSKCMGKDLGTYKIQGCKWQAKYSSAGF